MRIAVTGGIAEGKSTVLSYIEGEGYSVASGDQIARDIFVRPEVQAAIALATGLGSPLDPVGLRNAIAASHRTRRAVNRLMHPFIVNALQESNADFVEVPLLIETCLQGWFDQVWVVTCGEAEQRRRLSERYGAEADIDALLGSQLRTRAKIPFSDRVIRTNEPEETVRRILSKCLKQVGQQ